MVAFVRGNFIKRNSSTPTQQQGGAGGQQSTNPGFNRYTYSKLLSEDAAKCLIDN